MLSDCYKCILILYLSSVSSFICVTSGRTKTHEVGAFDCLLEFINIYIDAVKLLYATYKN